MSDAAATAAYRRALSRAGQAVTFQRRALGAAPVTISAAATALVRNMTPDGPAVSREGYSAGKPGAALQVGRLVIVLETDLAAAGFPTPVVKGDRIRVARTGEWLQVEEIDGNKRALAGATEMIAKSIA